MDKNGIRLERVKMTIEEASFIAEYKEDFLRWVLRTAAKHDLLAWIQKGMDNTEFQNWSLDYIDAGEHSIDAFREDLERGYYGNGTL